MNAKLVLLAVLVVSAFMAGCQSTAADYSAYGQQPPQQNQYVGGGCGVAPGADYQDVSSDLSGKSSAA